jgi:hypothetical protein
MDIRVHIDDRLVGFFRALLRPRVVLATILFVGLGTAGTLYATGTALTVFTPGTAISASAVNANFASLEDRIATLETHLPGWGIVDAPLTIPQGTSRGITVVCGPGRRVTGGGFRFGSDAGPLLRLNFSNPSSTGDGWQVNVTNVDTAPLTEKTIIAYAVCANASTP